MSTHTSKDGCITEINARPTAATHYSEQLFWSSKADNGAKCPERHLLGTLAYMASVAFYAGKTPTQFVDELELKHKSRNLGVEELMTDGTRITHLNKRELEMCVECVVKIHLKDALHLLDKDIMVRNESDPFVVFQSGSSMVKSDMLKDKVDARWNSTHYLFIRKKSLLKDAITKMKVFLFDGDKLCGRDQMSLADMHKFDDLLANTEVDLELSRGDKNVKDYPITFSSRRNRFAKKMTLNFSTQLLTVDEFCNEIGYSGEEHWLDAHTMSNPTVDWMKLFEKIKLPHVNLHPSICFESKATSTQGWVHILREKKVVIVAFKGTDVREWKDVVTDLKSLPATLDPLAKDEFCLKPGRALRNRGSKIHMGFRDAYTSVRQTILDTVFSVTDWSQDWLVVLTGHSLGGALASVAAFEAANRWYHGRRPKVAMINFGSPRIANEAFSESYSQTVPVSFRFRHCSDIIPCFPPNLCHVDHLVKGNPDGTMTVIYHEQGQKFGDHTHKENKQDQTLREAMANRPDIVHHQQPAYYDRMKQAIRMVFPSFQKN